MQFPHVEQQTRGVAPFRLAPPVAPQFFYLTVTDDK